MSLETGHRVGKYTVGHKLGQGGFGILYVARDTELERDIAIKFLRPEHAFKQQVVQRFLQEARAAARIAHPGIVTVYESGQVSGTNTRADGTVYIAMELLAGDTLAHRIKASGRLPPGIAIGFCRQMADALAAAHAAGIIHRDLKPQNVFLVRDPAVVGGERVKVLDFGIAKLLDDFGGNIQTHSLVMLGTPMYMSPEQCKSSAKVDARSDIYSLGCILFEMLTGKTPFDGDSGELIAKHQLVAPPTARSLLPDLPQELDSLVASMLAKAPDQRPQTMSAVVDVLDAIEERIAPGPEVTGEAPALSGEPGSVTTVASSPNAVRRATAFSKLTARGRVIGTAALAITLGVCAGVVAMRDDDEPAGASAAVAASDDSVVTALDAGAAVAASDAPVPPIPPPPPATRVSNDELDQLVLECRRLGIEAKTEQCMACAARISSLDETRGLELEALCEDITIDAAVAAAPAAKPAPKRATNDCAEQRKENGMASISMGQHATALAHFEASLACKDDPYVRQLAFMEACASGNSPKATHYYELLTPKQQDKFAAICERQRPPVAYTAKCSSQTAEALKEQGMENINMGEHEAALAKFEAAIRCKDDPYIRQLAFMEACASGNSKKAKLYYTRLTPAQQSKFAQICIRQKPPVAYE